MTQDTKQPGDTRMGDAVGASVGAANGSTTIIVMIGVLTLSLVLAIAALAIWGPPGSLATTIAALSAIVIPTAAASLSYVQSKQAAEVARQAYEQSIVGTQKTEQLEIKVDGRLTELLRLTATQAEAQAKLDAGEVARELAAKTAELARELALKVTVQVAEATAKVPDALPAQPAPDVVPVETRTEAAKKR